MKRKSVFFVVSILALAFILNQVFLSTTLTQAATVDELKGQREKLSVKLEEINNKIKQLQGQISSNQKEQASLKNEVRIFEAQIQTTELAIQAKETQMEDAGLQIKELGKQIDRRNLELAEQKQNLASLVTMLHELDENSGLQLAFGTDSFSAVLDQIEYTSQLQHKIYTTVKNIKDVKTALESQKNERTLHLAELEKLKVEMEEQQSVLAVQRNDKQKLLTQTKGVESTYRKLLAASNEEKDNFEKEIEDLDQEVRKALGSRSIQPGKGVLQRPMAGVITQGYGPTTFKALGYSVHNGLDIAGPANTPIYAAGDGEVTACNSSNAAYGNWCTVKHNIQTKSGSRCIVSLYAHMNSISVKAGQKVQQGDLIGKEGNTGNTTRLLYGPHRGFHLHFTIFDCEGFGISEGKYSKSYGTYRVPYGYTYNPMDFF